MEEKKERKELSDEAAATEEINEADGLPIYHANEGEGEGEDESRNADESKEEADDGKEKDMH